MSQREYSKDFSFLSGQLHDLKTDKKQMLCSDNKIYQIKFLNKVNDLRNKQKCCMR